MYKRADRELTPLIVPGNLFIHPVDRAPCCRHPHMLRYTPIRLCAIDVDPTCRSSPALSVPLRLGVSRHHPTILLRDTGLGSSTTFNAGIISSESKPISDGGDMTLAGGTLLDF